MSVGKNSIANLLGSIVPLFVTIITVPIYLMLIGHERYGVLAVIWVVFSYFGFFDFGLGRATTQKMAKLKDSSILERSKLFWTSFLMTLPLGIIGGVILWFFAGKLLSNTGSLEEAIYKEYVESILWLIPSLPILLATSVMNGALQGRERFVEINIIAVVSNILIQILPLSIAYLGFVELEYLVPAALTGRLIGGIYLFYKCKINIPLSMNITFNKSAVKPLLSYGGWISVIGVIGPLLVVADRVVIASLAGAMAVSYYTIPYSLTSRVSLLSNSLANSIFPKMASMQADEALGLADRSTSMLITILTPIVIFTLPLIDPFLVVWVGKEFAYKSTGVGEIILVGAWINTLVIPHNISLQADGKKLKKVVIIYLFEIPIYFFMLWVGLKNLGVVGAAIAWTIRMAIDSTLLLILCGAFKRILLLSLFPALLIGFAISLRFFSVEYQFLHWMGTICLLFFSVFINWKEISNLFNRVILRERSV